MSSDHAELAATVNGQQVHSSPESSAQAVTMRIKPEDNTNIISSNSLKRLRSDSLPSGASERKRTRLHITYKNAERDRLWELEHMCKRKMGRRIAHSLASASPTVSVKITPKHSAGKLCLHIKYKNTTCDRLRQWECLNGGSSGSRSSSGGDNDIASGRDGAVRSSTVARTSSNNTISTNNSTGTTSNVGTNASTATTLNSISTPSSTTTEGQQKRKPMLRITYKNAARDRERERHYMTLLGRPHP